MSDTAPDSLIPYDEIVQEALRAVVGRVLRQIERSGAMLPGAHHFYITFKTRAPGVSVPPDVSAKYPDEMTIVLQHQYWDLTVEHDMFSVMLKFGGMPKVLTMPYTAVTRFYDPSVKFLLQFEAPEVAEEPVADIADAPKHVESRPISDDNGPKVVSLDQFRKK